MKLVSRRLSATATEFMSVSFLRLLVTGSLLVEQHLQVRLGGPTLRTRRSCFPKEEGWLPSIVPALAWRKTKSD